MNKAGSLMRGINLNHPGHYVHWGVVQISVANLVVVLVMIAIFVAAVLLPFPGNRRRK
jgi:uncharacterized iron-regulated membrane protein